MNGDMRRNIQHFMPKIALPVLRSRQIIPVRGEVSVFEITPEGLCFID